MRFLSLFLFLNLMISNLLLSQDIAVVTGQLKNHEIKSISLQCDENPFTGAREEFKAAIPDSGNFEIFVKMYASGTYNLLINNIPVSQIFLCPGQNLSVYLDSTGFKYTGITGDFQEWNRALVAVLNQYTFGAAVNDSVLISNARIHHLFEQKKQNETQISKISSDFRLDSCEQNYCKYRNDYAIYTFIWSELMQKGYSIESDVYNYLKDLPLDDTDAVRSSLDYNRAVSVYIFLKLRLDEGWYEPNSFDVASDGFNSLFYNKILTEIQNEEVRNHTLTRNIIGLLSSGSSSAENLAKQYFTDCTNSYYKNIVYEFYNAYEKQKNASPGDPAIKQLSGVLKDQLAEYKGAVVYLDFWASWCMPCRSAIPFSKELQSKYTDRAFQVVYVNIDDNYGAFESTAKKLGLNKNLIYLNKEQSTEVREQFKINGIPHYVLLDKNGKILTNNAPGPDSSAIDKALEEIFAE